ncbi:MAG TPA: hypothetical protein VJS38_01400 [Phenylobacterium sp.]|uniref:hypothetical protein n=1 Tax=Phenylobacterium sp. TaxID=1871053 RepID=UPI002B48A93E|nr:hypothetical protein [Phenylobacterium sp.]HKR86806.1 hypothetical protein [Phenylobacterium sp.]
MVQTALVFGVDRRGQVRHSRELEFTSRADLLRQLAPVFDQHPLVEAWNGAICVCRMGLGSGPDLEEADAF